MRQDQIKVGARVRDLRRIFPNEGTIVAVDDCGFCISWWVGSSGLDYPFSYCSDFEVIGDDEANRRYEHAMKYL